MKHLIWSVVLLIGTLSARGFGQATQPVEGARPAVVYLLPEGQTYGRYRPGAVPFGQPAPTVVAPEDIAQQYSCVLRLDAEDDSTGTYAGLVANDPQAAVALLTSTALIDPAVDKTVKLSPRQRRADVVVNVYPVGQRLARLEVILRNEGDVKYPADGAEKLAAALVEQLRAAYEQSAQTSRKAAAARRAPLEKELAAARTRLDEIRGKEHEVRSQMSNIPQYGDANATLINLRNQKRSIDSELSRNRARLAALEPASAPAGSGWAEVVQLRQQRLDEMKKNKAPAADIAEQETRLAEAKAQLSQSRRTGVSMPNEQYRNNELVNLKTSIADAEERIKPINEQIAKLEDPKFVALVDQLPEMQQEENRLRSQIADLTNRLDQLHRTAQAEGSVTVTVLDGKQR